MQVSTKAGSTITDIATIPFMEFVKVGGCNTQDETQQGLISSFSFSSFRVTVKITGDKIDELHATADKFFNGMQLRSKYAIASEATVGRADMLGFEKGDLIVLDGIWEDHVDSEHASGVCVRNKRRGHIDQAKIFVIPAMGMRPEDGVIATFVDWVVKGAH